MSILMLCQSLVALDHPIQSEKGDNDLMALENTIKPLSLCVPWIHNHGETTMAYSRPPFFTMWWH